MIFEISQLIFHFMPLLSASRVCSIRSYFALIAFYLISIYELHTMLPLPIRIVSCSLLFCSHKLKLFLDSSDKINDDRRRRVEFVFCYSLVAKLF